ncbi:hypothetical protein HDU91_005153 [Kappamyces sp. JEL0680]|nr:hypothetical protein HDU91_005153 [Kappamyces sp. JEL0680]
MSSPTHPVKAPFADNPTQGLVPLSITPLCLARMQGWLTIVGHLIKYLSIVSLLQDMTDQQAKRASIRAGSANNIDEQLIPILKELQVEIKRKCSDVSKWAVLDNALAADLDTYNKLAGNVRSSLMRQQWKGDAAEAHDVKDGVKDPWLANMALQKHIAACFERQKDYRSQIIAQEQDFAAFEAVVVQNIKVSLATFYEWRAGTFGQQIDQIKQMQTQLGQMDPERDWSLFTLHNDHRFLVHPSEFVQIRSVDYDGSDDPLVNVVKQGQLLRKEGVFKRTYKPIHAVLTASSYFHSFPELAKGEKLSNLVPDLTVDLTECTLVPLMMNEKEPEEIALLGKPGLFGKEVKHKFRGDTMNESAEWWGSINEQMKKYNTRNVPTKVAGESDIPAAPSKLAPKQPSPTTELPSRPKPSPSPAPLPPRRSMSPPARSPGFAAHPSSPVAVEPVHATMAPDFVSPELEKERAALNSLSLAEQMELKLQSRTGGQAATPQVPELEMPTFDAPVRTNQTSVANPWDTLDANEGGW